MTNIQIDSLEELGIIVKDLVFNRTCVFAPEYDGRDIILRMPKGKYARKFYKAIGGRVKSVNTPYAKVLIEEHDGGVVFLDKQGYAYYPAQYAEHKNMLKYIEGVETLDPLVKIFKSGSGEVLYYIPFSKAIVSLHETGTQNYV